jgi:hypothetical protein
MPNENPNITWNLSLEHANLVLQCLGKQKFDRVADLMIDLRQQAAKNIQTWQEAQKAMQMPVPERPNGIGHQDHAS